jgi:hypothetical protein
MFRSVFICVGFFGFAAIGSPVVTINFDDLGTAPTLFVNANPLRNEYSALGVTFSGPGPLDGGAVLSGSSFGVSALSGPNLLAYSRSATATLLNGGKPLPPGTLTFSTPALNVSIYASGGTQAAAFQITAYNAMNNVVGVGTVSTAGGQWGLLSVSASSIARAEITETSGDVAFVFDNLSFTPVPEPATILALGLGVAAVVRRRRSR